MLSLLSKSPAQVDYIELNGDADLETLDRALALRPVLLHDIAGDVWLNYEHPFEETRMAKARAMMERARPPWHSTGIGASAEPQGHTTEYWRGAPAGALQPRAVALANIVRNGRWLKDWLGIPLLLENFNYHPTNAYEYVCEPETFRALIEQIDSGVLLDLAHAQISAFNMGWPDPRAYLEQLPLDRVVEIHFNQPYNDHGKQMLDRHMSVQPKDIELLRWVLERTPRAQVVNLESESPSEAALSKEIRLLRELLNELPA